MKNKLIEFSKQCFALIKLIIATSGIVLNPLNFLNAILIAVSIAFSYITANYLSENITVALIYYIVFEILYIGAIFSILPKNGLRLWFIKKFKSETKAYVFYQSILGFLFFNNGLSMSYFSTSTKSEIFADIPEFIIIAVFGLIFSVGYIIKLWSAKVVGIDIYFWKDMFLGRKICEFVCCGPYRFISNPMYGIGQLQGYAIALLNGSIPGLIIVFINQFLVFSFYFLVEKKFIKAVYLQPVENY